jgi:N-acetylglucosaminyldiphosphoundecaprenol N-acetyl-beta-D-mannosaminyltransferase
MIGKSIIARFTWLVPALGCLVLLGAAAGGQRLLGVPLSGWLRAGLFVLWLAMAMGYVLQFNLLHRIGGFMVVVVVSLILTGALLPKQRVAAYPGIASAQVVRDLDAAWGAVWGKNLFKDFNLKDRLLDYARSLAGFDIFQQGKILAFLLLGFLLGVCFLFMEDPSAYGAYGGRAAQVLVGGALLGLQVELLQVVSPTREVRWAGVLDSWLGLGVGLLLFILIQWFFAARTRHHPGAGIRFNVLGVGVDAVNMRDCLARFERLIREGVRPAMTSALGVAGIMAARRDQRVQRILNESVLNAPDGMPLVWLGRLLGYRNIERVYGPDLLREVCAYSAAKGWRHFFYGAAPGVVERLQVRMEALYPGIQIVGTGCPPYRPLRTEEEAALIEKVRQTRPDIFWIGISTPRQLHLMDALRDRLACKIICPVGYAFDINAGVELDAPEWIKVAGFQWLHRALKQPRLWKRYLPDNPSFVIRVFAQLLGLKKFPLFVHEQPRTCFRDAEGFPRFPVGVVSLSALSLREARDRVVRWIETRQRHYVNICTADTIVQCSTQPQLAKIVCEAGMATTDGMPLVWLAKRHGFHEATRVYGPDLMLELCAAGYRHYFYGGTEEVLIKLKERLLQQFPRLQIVGMYAPPFRALTPEEEDDTVRKINAAQPDIVWCGLGTPKQDYWVHHFRPRLEAAALIAVGAAFNFHAGYVRQAPRWMMRAGLEWLFRLLMEPRRLWRRYLIGNPRFLWLVWKYRKCH